MIKGIRGATTVDKNSDDAISQAVIELFSELIKKNKLEEDNISHIIFSTTKDINAAYPAKVVRKNLGWNNTAMMCLQEMDVVNSLKMCIRVLVVYNCDKTFIPQYIYLKNAKNLRK